MNRQRACKEIYGIGSWIHCGLNVRDKKLVTNTMQQQTVASVVAAVCRGFSRASAAAEKNYSKLVKKTPIPNEQCHREQPLVVWNNM